MLRFQGMNNNKISMTYKWGGRGFQCDTMCDKGYTFYLYFCHDGLSTTSGHEFSEISEQVIWNFWHLKSKWT